MPHVLISHSGHNLFWLFSCTMLDLSYTKYIRKTYHIGIELESKFIFSARPLVLLCWRTVVVYLLWYGLIKINQDVWSLVLGIIYIRSQYHNFLINVVELKEMLQYSSAKAELSYHADWTESMACRWEALEAMWHSILLMAWQADQDPLVGYFVCIET